MSVAWHVDHCSVFNTESSNHAPERRFGWEERYARRLRPSRAWHACHTKSILRWLQRASSAASRLGEGLIHRRTAQARGAIAVLLGQPCLLESGNNYDPHFPIKAR
jgi:hypothetical protein